MRKHVLVWFFRFLGVVGVLLLAGCGGGSPAKGKTLVYVNPGDGVLAASSDPDGPAVFGVRDANGIPTRITEIVIPAANKDPNDKARVLFNADQKTEQVLLGSGDSASVEYVSATRIIMTIRSVKSSTSERVPIDLSAQSAVQQNSAKALQNIRPLAVSLRGTVESRCGSTPLYAVVQGSYKTVLSKGTPIAFTQLSAGNWEYYLPALPANDKNAKLRQVLDTARDLWGNLCAADATASLFFKNTKATDAAIDLACGQYFKTESGKAVCLRLGRRLVELCDVKDQLLNQAEIELTDSYADSYDLKILVSYPDTGYSSKLFDFSVKASDVNIPNKRSDIATDPSNTLKASIQDFTISPADPAPKQSYTVSVTVFCAPEDTQLQISVVGTDKYTNTKVFTITSLNPKASLSIPGGGDSVQDTISAKILPSGPEKSTTITF